MESQTGGSRGSWPYVDRRRTPDRRQAPTGALAVLRGHRRRHRGRRRGERENTYADRIAAGDLLLVLAIFTLNLADAGLTLDHIGRGASEANPVMDAALAVSPGAFLLEKIAVVGTCLVLLVLHRHFRLARLGLWALFAVYAGLFGYHLYLKLVFH